MTKAILESTTALSPRGTLFAPRHIIKDGEGDGEGDGPPPGLEELSAQLSEITDLVTKQRQTAEEQYTELTNLANGVKDDQGEIRAKVEEKSAEYADSMSQLKELQAQLDLVKKELDAPLYKGGKDLDDSDTEAAIELQRRAHIRKGGDPEEFVPDMDNLVDAKVYRKITQKLMKVGLEEKQKIIRRFDEVEQKNYEAASLDIGFFMPEMLGLEIDCNIECWDLQDLYFAVNVSRSNFMYPRINDYGKIGAYGCDAGCDGPPGSDGNIQFLSGQTHEYRGMFCFQRKVLQESNYDLFAFMIRAIQRAYRIERNRVAISGTGINEPLGWLNARCFQPIRTPANTFNHQIARQFILSAPVEYGPVTVVMHQNVFAYLASSVDNNGRFIFGDGVMNFTPDNVERLRISNCLPDPTQGMTRGNAASPFVAGTFIMAAANWEMAYYNVSKEPMTIEQFQGGSNKWCVKYEFGAEDGGFIACCDAGRILQAG